MMFHWLKNQFRRNIGDALMLICIGFIAAISLLGMMLIPIAQSNVEPEPPPFVYEQMEMAAPHYSGKELIVWIHGRSESGERIFLIAGEIRCDNGYTHTFMPIYRPSYTPMTNDFKFGFERDNFPAIPAGVRCTYIHGAMDLVGSRADTTTVTFEVQP